MRLAHVISESLLFLYYFIRRVGRQNTKDGGVESRVSYINMLIVLGDCKFGFILEQTVLIYFTII